MDADFSERNVNRENGHHLSDEYIHIFREGLSQYKNKVIALVFLKMALLELDW